MKNSNANPRESNTFDLPTGEFGCAPRNSTEEDNNLLKLLIAQLDELTRPQYGGKLK